MLASAAVEPDREKMSPVPAGVATAGSSAPSVATDPRTSGADWVGPRNLSGEFPTKVQDGKIHPTAESPIEGDMAETPSDTSRLTVDTVPRQGLISSVFQRGTPPAEHSQTMQVLSEMNESADVVEQNLPTLPATMSVTASGATDRKVRGIVMETPSSLPAGTAEAIPGLVELSARRELTSAGDAAAPQAHVIEGVRRAIETATAGFKRSDGSSVAVEVRPDENTQFALHVKLLHGRFEVMAILERGDFAAFSADWPQLQHRLAEQGVRLSPLASGGENSNVSWSSSGRQTPDERGREKVPFEERSIPVGGRPETIRPRVRRAAAAGGSEWWA